MIDKTGPVGKTIDGKYEVISKIGQGGMGEVYRARHLMMDRVVALKLLRLHLVQDDEALRRFQQEAKAASRIDHPNAVTIYDFGQAEEGFCYIAMEFIEGLSLKQVLRDGGPVSPERSLPIIKQICSVLAEAHRLGVIHRDIKPENIMLCRKGSKEDVVKVLDFGIAKLLKDESSAGMTKTGMVFGTPKYMSPEQIQGKPLDGRSDIYALGCVIYEMLTGRPPFEGDADLDLMLKHLNNEPRPMRDTAPFLAAASELEQVVLRTLQKDSSKRMSADELARELEEAATGKYAPQPEDVARTTTMPSGAVAPPVAQPAPPQWTGPTYAPSGATPPPLPPPVAPAQPTPFFAAPSPPASRAPLVLGIAGAVLLVGIMAAGGIMYYMKQKPPELATGTSGTGDSTGQQLGGSSTSGTTTPPPVGPTGEPMAGSSEQPPTGPAAGTGTVATGGPAGTQSPAAEKPSAGQPPLYQRLSNDAVTEARNGRPEQAHRLLAEAIHQRPDSPELHFNLAQVFIIQKKYAEAAEELKLYLQYLPEPPDRSEVERLLAEIRSADSR